MQASRRHRLLPIERQQALSSNGTDFISVDLKANMAAAAGPDCASDCSVEDDRGLLTEGSNSHRQMATAADVVTRTKV